MIKTLKIIILIYTNTNIEACINSFNLILNVLDNRTSPSGFHYFRKHIQFVNSFHFLQNVTLGAKANHLE